MAGNLDRCPGCGVPVGVMHKPGCSYSNSYHFVWEAVDMPEKVLSGNEITIAIPPEVVQYRHDIRRFVEAMVFKLSVHASKGRWENKTAAERLDRLYDEAKELKEAMDRGNMVEIMLEAADVANYALIISAIVMERGK